jgi:diguanylate cyclase (GGDEF)-like protein
MDMEANVTPPVHQGMFASMRERLSRRSDSEHAQAIIRIVIASMIWLYLLFINSTGKLTADQHHAIFVVSYFILAAVGLFALIVIWPQALPPRRFLGMALDFGAASYLMYVLEDKALPFFAVYLWVVIGNGLRYGLRYLYVAMAVSILSFTVAFTVSAYWRAQWGFSVGLLIGLVALPLYFSSLLKQLSRQHNELKKLYELTARHATHDSLTGLPNRKHFHDHLADTITSAKRDKQIFAVLYLDLDGFKAINDALGHAAGDQVIENTARRLEQCVRKGDMVARVGGDEFVVLLRDIDTIDVAKVAEKIIKILSDSFTIAAEPLYITTSIGVASYPHDGEDASALIHSADSAMYEAKRSGKNGYRICNSTLVRLVQ